MKTYKPYYKDSDRLIVLDENMKTMGFFTWATKASTPLFVLFGLSFLVAIIFRSDFIYAKMESIDQWLEHPENKLLLDYYLLGIGIVSGIWYVLWVFLLRKKP
jgi:hypothetical protein